MKHIFIINPTSGKHHAIQLIPVIERYFESHSEPYSIIRTERPGHATEIAKHYKAEDDVTLYVLSGDGTANEVLNGLRPDVPMAVIPVGSGNDFFRMLEVPIMPLEQLLIETIEGKEVIVDYGMANDRRYLNCSSMGFDADIGIYAHAIKMKYPFLSGLSYVIATIALLIKRKPMKMHLIFNDEDIEVECLLVAIMNGRFYGGGFNPTPMASIQDGSLDLCVIRNTNLLRILSLLPKFKVGKHIHEDIVTFYKVKALKLSSAEIINTQCDGEVYPEQHINFKLVEQALKLRVPQRSQLKE